MELLHMFDFIMNNPKFIWAVISIIGVIFGVITLIQFHLSETYKKFNIIELISIDQSTGSPSDSKLRLNIAFIVMTWAFVYITMQDKLTEWYVVVYAGAWVTDRFLARWVKTDKDENK